MNISNLQMGKPWHSKTKELLQDTQLIIGRGRIWACTQTSFKAWSLSHNYPPRRIWFSAASLSSSVLISFYFSFFPLLFCFCCFVENHITVFMWVFMGSQFCSVVLVPSLHSPCLSLSLPCPSLPTTPFSNVTLFAVWFLYKSWVWVTFVFWLCSTSILC